MLEVRELTKYYSNFPAVQRVSFTVSPGECIGCLGPNGSGKSTTVNMLTGLLEPTEGEVLYQGRNVQRDLTEYKKRLGYVPEVPYIYPFLTGREYLRMVGLLRLMPSRVIGRKIDGFMELFSLGSEGHARISAYSKGMRQKILVAAALLHDPEVLIFDEPLSGMDVSSARIFRSLVEALRREGKIVVYSSHVMEAVEKVCSRIVILDKGRVVANDSVSVLRGSAKAVSLEDVFSRLVLKDDAPAVAASIVDVMKIRG
jgi:ABC-2 type transport system ATP-binding protein